MIEESVPFSSDKRYATTQVKAPPQLQKTGAVRVLTVSHGFVYEPYALHEKISWWRSSPARFDEDYNLKWFSESITIVDQSVHELCSLVSDSVLELSRGLLELQSALEGFLILIGYEQKHGDWKFNSTENHPFVRVCDTHSRSSCRHEALPVFRLLMRCLKASCVMLNKGKHIVEVVSMLVTILQYQAYL
ncbi:hypothetical protein Bca52824_048556 [Brassica carinata]|uniref:Uncharacterized protein n=1 Tax=Brassica carinata TaxID=52824 RepID=A0A8X7RJ77_BRACI|nr:hypothetical protein Bca52824_048556 [Brassica carinata]